MSDDIPCPKHSQGHCWHKNGVTGYSGRYESRTPVRCCHCGATATQVHVTQPMRIECYSYSAADVADVAEAQREVMIRHMVNRFLGWRLPDNFSPDAGISFNRFYNVEFNAARGLPPSRREPIGTNLFDAAQAEAMVRYMIEGLPVDGKSEHE